MSAKEELVDFISTLTQEEVEAILANFGQIAALAAVMAGEKVKA